MTRTSPTRNILRLKASTRAWQLCGGIQQSLTCGRGLSRCSHLAALDRGSHLAQVARPELDRQRLPRHARLVHLRGYAVYASSITHSHSSGVAHTTIRTSGNETYAYHDLVGLARARAKTCLRFPGYLSASLQPKYHLDNDGLFLARRRRIDVAVGRDGGAGG